MSAMAPNGMAEPPLRRELPLSVRMILPCLRDRAGDWGGAARRMTPFVTSSDLGVRVHPLAVRTATRVSGAHGRERDTSGRPPPPHGQHATAAALSLTAKERPHTRGDGGVVDRGAALVVPSHGIRTRRQQRVHNLSTRPSGKHAREPRVETRQVHDAYHLLCRAPETWRHAAASTGYLGRNQQAADKGKRALVNHRTDRRTRVRRVGICTMRQQQADHGTVAPQCSSAQRCRAVCLARSARTHVSGRCEHSVVNNRPLTLASSVYIGTFVLQEPPHLHRWNAGVRLRGRAGVRPPCVPPDPAAG